ncbi:hypothetical protein SEA_DOGFISH_1 [Gordonia phage Dogfish]|nr:hypothetical protein SEA_DOGFISH_1 [Gordonia phage Dogfish]
MPEERKAIVTKGEGPLTVRARVRSRRAIQWNGRYHHGEHIAHVLNGRVIVWPVPCGYEHQLRREHEFDRSNGHILDTAAAYLVVYRSGADEDPQRVDRGWWFVWDDDEVQVVGPDEFPKIYFVEDDGGT